MSGHNFRVQLVCLSRAFVHFVHILVNTIRMDFQISLKLFIFSIRNIKKSLWDILLAEKRQLQTIIGL